MPSLPILFLQQLSRDGPGHLGRVLARAGRQIDARDAEQHDPFPDRIDGYAGLVVLGGEMSANDDLPQLRAAEHLIRAAIDADIPVLGHCLGAQLLARVVGGKVLLSPQPEIGWWPVHVHASPAARQWFGGGAAHTALHWHHEYAELPPSIDVLARSEACTVQAFAFGPHLATQFHLEMDSDKLAAATRREDERHRASLGAPHVQTVREIAALSDRHLRDQQRLADHVYAAWLANVR